MKLPVRLALAGPGTATHTVLVETQPNSLPMTRLFDECDIEFLRALPGHTGKAEAEFRRRRCRIFRAYLLGLRAGFLRELNEPDMPAGAGVLRYRLEFALAMLPAYGRLFRYRWGLGNVDLTDVVQRFDAILAGLRALDSASLLGC
jgi:hypothetical protein